MFKNLSFLILSICLLGCQQPSNIDGFERNSEIKINLNSAIATLECKGEIEFTKKDGILSGFHDDMELIAETFCDSDVKVTHRNADVNAIDGSNFLIGAQIEFRCAMDGKLDLSKSDLIPNLCEKAFAGFNSQQP